MEFVTPERTVDTLMQYPDYDFRARAQDLIDKGIMDCQSAFAVAEDVNKFKRQLQRFASNLVVKNRRYELASGQELDTKGLLDRLCYFADRCF